MATGLKPAHTRTSPGRQPGRACFGHQGGPNDARLALALVLVLAALLLLAAPRAAGAAHGTGVAAASAAEPVDRWPVVGRQGLLQLVIVPLAQASDDAAYREQIALLCPPGQSCFVNFYTNRSGAALTVPLPEAVSREATAIFRRSIKQGADLMQWHCRLQRTESPCF